MLLAASLLFAICIQAHGDDKSDAFVASQKSHAVKFSRETTNLQYNKDGSVGLIRLSEPSVDDAALAQLPNFPRLKYLAIVAPKVTDDGIVHITALDQLDSLLVSETLISSSGLHSIRGLTQLKNLALTKSNFTRIPNGVFDELTNVTSLSLSETDIDDESINEIVKLSNLESLILDKTLVTDKGVAKLAALKNLRLLSLGDCEITGTAFASFQSDASLTNLILSGTKVTKDGLEQIAKISSLRTVELYETDVSESAIVDLKRSLINAKVFTAQSSKLNDAEIAKKILDEIAAAKSATKKPASDILAPINQRLDQKPEIQFQRHVVPLLGRLGCNSRSCHGSFQGRGGFRLSMFGYDFDLDHKNVAERIDLDSPAESLLTNKPLSADQHEGGKRFEAGSWQQKLLHQWIVSGAASVGKDAATFVRLDVTPREISFRSEGQTQQLRAVAVWSDGTRENVTCLTRFETKDDAVAVVTPDGMVTAKGPGDTHIISYYDNGIQPVQTILPFGPTQDVITPHHAETEIDKFAMAKLNKLGIHPSELTTDAEFLRRVSLDMIGTLPTPALILEFIADQSQDKRERKIDELLQHPAYVAWWTNRLCDLTGSNAGFLGSTEMAYPTSLQWQAWIQRRVKENVGWDQIAIDIITATSRPDGQTYRDFVHQQSMYTKRNDGEDFAALGNPMPHYWYRSNIKIPSDKTLSFGYIFMGLRLDCAQCHKHPFDQWSQTDFELFTEFFKRVKTGVAPDAAAVHSVYRNQLAVPNKLNTAALRRQSYLRIAAEGRPIPWNEVWVQRPYGKEQTAKLLGSAQVDLNRIGDPRELLAQWLRSEPRRYLAKAFVNRIWANYFGAGIINPTDDLNLANPPSHPELLDYLTTEFIRHKYDMKWLHKTITNSRTYQLSWRPNKSNIDDHKNLSHAQLRRLPAEVIIDAVHQATAANQMIDNVGTNVATRKISQHPRSYQTRSIDYSLLVFGKSLRSSNCDCERNPSPTLPQSLYLRNDGELLKLIDRPDGWLQELSQQKNIDAKLMIKQAYLRTLSRLPTATESKTSIAHIDEAAKPLDGVRDLLWALINTQEFIANR